MPKRPCTDRAKWRLLRGKPAQPLSAHYQLDCDYGTPVLTIYREGEGDTPTYLCEVHAAAERDAAAARPSSRPIGEDISIVELDRSVIATADPAPALGNPPIAQRFEQVAQHSLEHASPIQSTETVVAKVKPRTRKSASTAATSSDPAPKVSAPATKSSVPAPAPVTRPLTPSSLAANPTAPVAKPEVPVSIESVPDPPSSSPRVPPVKVNSSSKGPARDLAYGNPAKALVDETIWNLQPGDYDAYRTALREGKSVTEAAQAAGGQLAVVHRKIQEYTARLDALLSASNAAINVDDAIQRVLEAETLSIIADNATPDDLKDLALARLGEFQESMNRGLKPAATPVKAHTLALAIAERANWGAAGDSVPNELRSAYRAVYNSLRHAIHTAIPDVRDFDDRLANLYAAKSELESTRNTPISAPDSCIAPGSLQEAKVAAT